MNGWVGWEDTEKEREREREVREFIFIYYLFIYWGKNGDFYGRGRMRHVTPVDFPSGATEKERKKTDS